LSATAAAPAAKWQARLFDTRILSPTSAGGASPDQDLLGDDEVEIEVRTAGPEISATSCMRWGLLPDEGGGRWLLRSDARHGSRRRRDPGGPRRSRRSAPGDAVIAFLPPALPSLNRVAPPRLPPLAVARKPADWSVCRGPRRCRPAFFHPPTTPCTNWRACARGERVLIHGAAGGVGHRRDPASRKHLGAEIFRDRGAAMRSVDFVRPALGADHVFDSALASASRMK